VPRRRCITTIISAIRARRSNEQACKLELEGIVSKRADAPYAPGNRGHCTSFSIPIAICRRRIPVAPASRPTRSRLRPNTSPPAPRARARARETAGNQRPWPARQGRAAIAPSAAARRSLLRRQPRILFDAIGGGGAEPGFGRGNGRRLGLAETHIQPHLAVGDVAAGQAAVPHRGEEPACYRPTATARKHGPLRGPAGRQIRNSGRATPSLRRASGDTPSS
jgi:hypothetical protein